MVVASSTIVLYDSDGALLGQGSVHGTDTVSWERRPFRDNREIRVGLALLLSHHTTAGSTRLLPGTSRLPRGHRMSASRSQAFWRPRSDHLHGDPVRSCG
jgi:hypothetical protein